MIEQIAYARLQCGLRNLKYAAIVKGKYPGEDLRIESKHYKNTIKIGNSDFYIYDLNEVLDEFEKDINVTYRFSIFKNSQDSGELWDFGIFDKQFETSRKGLYSTSENNYIFYLSEDNIKNSEIEQGNSDNSSHLIASVVGMFKHFMSGLLFEDLSNPEKMKGP